MNLRQTLLAAVAIAGLTACQRAPDADVAREGAPAARPLRGEGLDRHVERLMREARVPGLALAVIEGGRVTHLKAYGLRDVEKNLPLTTNTVMYGASLTKGAFAYAVMTLVDEGKLDLDRPIADYLPRPLPDYEKYADLAGDERWRRLTARLLLSHRAGFANFRFYTPDGYDKNGKLRFHFDPGARYAYSGEGINLLQFVVEHGLGVDVGELMRRRVFDRFGMTRTSMTWRDDFAADLAVGHGERGEPLGHERRGGVRAAGSMDTTVADYASFLAGLARGEGLSAAAHAELLRPQVAIDSVQQFPTLREDATADNRGIALSYGLGWGVFRSPRGPAFFKEGHDDGTRNYALCLRESRDCVLILSNSANGDGAFKYLADAALGPTCLPWFWHNYVPYDRPAWRAPEARGRPHPPCAPLMPPFSP
jgi:CubicO group peptidase (beta-lactamase class C family)